VNLLMLLYMGWIRPTKGYLSLIVISAYEIMALIVNFCLVVLAVMDTKGVSDGDMRNKLLQIMIVMNTVISLSTSIFMWIYILILVHSAYVMSKTPGVRSKLFYINALFAVYRSPGMGFIGEDPYCDDFEQANIVIKNGEKHVKLLRNRNKVHPIITVTSPSQRPSVLETKSEVSSGGLRASIKNTSDNLITNHTTGFESATSSGKTTAEKKLGGFFRRDSDLKILGMTDSETDVPEYGRMFSPPWSTQELSNNSSMIQESGPIVNGRPFIATPPDIRLRNLMKIKLNRGTPPNVGTLSSLRKPPSIILEEMSPSHRLGDESPYVGGLKSSQRSISFMDRGAMSQFRSLAMEDQNGDNIRSPEFRKQNDPSPQNNNKEELRSKLQLFVAQGENEDSPMKSFQSFAKNWKGRETREDSGPNENGFHFSDSSSSASPDSKFSYSPQNALLGLKKKKSKEKVSSINLDIIPEGRRMRGISNEVIPEAEHTRDEIGESNSTMDEGRKGIGGVQRNKNIVSGLLYPYQFNNNNNNGLESISGRGNTSNRIRSGIGAGQDNKN